MMLIGFIKRIWRFIHDNVSYLTMLVATFLAMALIVGMTFGSFYDNAKDNTVSIGNATASNEARSIDNRLLQGLNTLQVTTLTIDYMSHHNSTATQMQAYLAQQSKDIQSRIDPSFSGVYGVVHNVYIDGNGWTPGADYSPYNRPWYTAAKALGGKVSVSSPYIDAKTGSNMISYSQMLSDGVSAISLDMRLDEIQKTTETIRLNGYGYCFVVDNNGLIVAHRNKYEQGRNYLTDTAMANTDMQKLVKEVLDADGKVLDMKVNGSNCMVFSKSVQDTWRVVLVVSKTDLFRDIHASLSRNILISLVIFLLVGYFCTSNYFNKKKAVKYAEEVRTDTLTGLNNRGELDRFISATTSGIPSGTNLYLMLFDADGFKKINDKFGHTEGDRALQYIAEALRSVCESTDSFCARYGGDEFVIVCKCRVKDDAHEISARISEKLRVIAQQHKLQYRLTLSVGIAEYNMQGQTIPELFDAADQDLYRMKAAKKRQTPQDI